MATFQEKLKQALGEKGYDNGMRRSVQTVVLFEANRMIKDKLNALRPFQRKLAFFDQALALVDELDCLPTPQRDEILWRTASSKEQMEAETAWKRMKMIEKDIEKMAEKIKPLCTEGKTHDEVCSEYVQQLYEKVSGEKGPRPPDWEHAHNNLVLCYRMYYKLAELDPDFPKPGPAKEIVVPATKPKPPPSSGDSADGGGAGGDAPAVVPVEPAAQRREIIQEVGEYMKILKDFEGAVPVQLLEKRKRELFEALPAAPPSLAERLKQRR